MRKRIMIVDDDSDMLKLLGMILRRHGYDTVAEVCSTAVMNRVDDEHPDLFILDVMMPDLNGIELCRQLRAHNATSHTPIIFLSAKVDRKSVNAGLDAGGDDYLPKTSLTGELIKTIQSLLDSRVPVMADS